MVSEYKYLVRWTAQYKKDVKLAKRRHYDIADGTVAGGGGILLARAVRGLGASSRTGC